MHNNFYFLLQLTARLRQILTGTIISECFSQNKDELIVRFETHADPFYLKASLGPGLSHLSFPASIQRAKRNSIDLFPELIGYRVQDIRQFVNERSFALLLEDEKCVLFRMHGNRSNIMLLENQEIIQVFKSNAPVEDNINLDDLDRTIDWSFETFLAHQNDPGKLYFTFGKVIWDYLKHQGFEKSDPQQKWEMVQSLRRELERPSFFITPIKGTPHLTLVSFAESKKLEDDPLQAANTFFQAFSRQTGLEKMKGTLISQIRNRIKGSENYYNKNFQKLAEIEREQNYKIWADLLMANLHNIKQGEEKVVLPDFYQEGHMVEIRLKKELSPQKNAALFYRKAKNQHLEIERIQHALRGKEKELESLKKQLAELEQITDLKTFNDKFPVNPGKKDKPTVTLPYFEFIFSGYRIWVGRGAHQNDELTLRYSYKEDLWLHVKDVPGSHVLIKYQSGKPFPKEVIERAAQLAAYNSKRKTETLCPVIVTPKKFVRKRKGDPPGTVVVEREDVIMVEPKL